MCVRARIYVGMSMVMSLIVRLSESLSLNISVSIPLNASSNLCMNKYSVRMSFAVSPSECKKIRLIMIASVSECDYWYEFERESE